MISTSKWHGTKHNKNNTLRTKGSADKTCNASPVLVKHQLRTEALSLTTVTWTRWPLTLDATPCKLANGKKVLESVGLFVCFQVKFCTFTYLVTLYNKVSLVYVLTNMFMLIFIKCLLLKIQVKLEKVQKFI